MVDRPDWTAAPFQGLQERWGYTVTVSESMPLTQLDTNLSGRSMVVQRIVFAATAYVGYELRGLCWLQVLVGNPPPGTVVAGGTISPESPSLVIPVEGGGLVIPPGATVSIRGWTAKGVGAAHISVAIEYYLGG